MRCNNKSCTLEVCFLVLLLKIRITTPMTCRNVTDFRLIPFYFCRREENWKDFLVSVIYVPVLETSYHVELHNEMEKNSKRFIKVIVNLAPLLFCCWSIVRHQTEDFGGFNRALHNGKIIIASWSIDADDFHSRLNFLWNYVMNYLTKNAENLFNLNLVETGQNPIKNLNQ